MSSQQQHEAEDVQRFGRPYPEVHRLLDQFAHYPDMKFLRQHRKFLHHWEGIAYVKMRWGEEAGQAAMHHIITDCGEVPNAMDYYDGTVDEFGIFRGAPRGSIRLSIGPEAERDAEGNLVSDRHE